MKMADAELLKSLDQYAGGGIGDGGIQRTHKQQPPLSLEGMPHAASAACAERSTHAAHTLERRIDHGRHRKRGGRLAHRRSHLVTAVSAPAPPPETPRATPSNARCR